MNLFLKKQPHDTPRRRQPRVPEANMPEAPDDRITFRRGRTLTGSVSSHISSVNETGADMKSPRVKTHELRSRRRRIGGLFVVIACSAALLLVLVLEFTAGVRVQIAGVSQPVDTSYSAAIQAYFSQHPLERFRFALNTESLSDYLQTKTPEVVSVRNGGSDGLGTSVVTLTMRRPVVGWTMHGKLQYVDATGTAFAKNYYQTPAVQVVDNSGVPVQAGRAVASDRFLGFVGRTVGLSSAQGYTVTQVVLPGATTRQIELHMQDIPYPIKMSADRAVGEQVEDMARAVKWFHGRQLTPRYVDVRVSGKAYYR